jgi:K+-transporting ATPase A subunit
MEANIFLAIVLVAVGLGPATLLLLVILFVWAGSYMHGRRPRALTLDKLEKRV